MRIKWLRAGSLGLLFFLAWNVFIQVAGTFRPDDPQPAGVNWGYIMQRASGAALVEVEDVYWNDGTLHVVVTIGGYTSGTPRVTLFYRPGTGGDWVSAIEVYTSTTANQTLDLTSSVLEAQTVYDLDVYYSDGVGASVEHIIQDFRTGSVSQGGWQPASIVLALLALTLGGVLAAVVSKSVVVCLTGMALAIGVTFLADRVATDTLQYVLTGVALLAAGFQCLFILRGVEHV